MASVLLRGKNPVLGGFFLNKKHCGRFGETGEMKRNGGGDLSLQKIYVKQ